MRHTVTISIAPVLCILDDAADPVSLVAIPLTFVFWLPCSLYALLSRLSWQIPQLATRARDYVSGWKSDLRLMASAGHSVWQAWTGCRSWAIGTG